MQIKAEYIQCRTNAILILVAGTILPKQDVYEGIIKYAIKNFDSKRLEVNMVTKRLDTADYLQIVTAGKRSFAEQI